MTKLHSIGVAATSVVLGEADIASSCRVDDARVVVVGEIVRAPLLRRRHGQRRNAQEALFRLAPRCLL